MKSSTLLFRNGIGFAVGATVFYADVVAAFALALLYGVVGIAVMRLPWVLAVVSAVVIGLGVWCIVRALPRSRPLKTRLEEWAERADDWIMPPVPRPAVVPKAVDYLAYILEDTVAPSPSAPVPASRSTEPRPLAWYELSGWTCPEPDCGMTASAGTHWWRDQSLHQLLSEHALECPNGHRWDNSTDGG